MLQILIIDDDVDLCELLSQYLLIEGIGADSCHDGKNGCLQILKKKYDLIILDIMLPKLDGFSVLKTLRQSTNTPVIMLSARGDDTNKIVGLESGADDYLSKPCNPRVLLARINAVLRRSKSTPELSNKKPIYTIDNLIMDTSQRTASIENKLIELTHTEFNILELLLRCPEQAVSKEELTEYGLGKKFSAYDRSIDVHISKLRAKIGNNAHGTSKIKTVHSFGYIFNCND